MMLSRRFHLHVNIRTFSTSKLRYNDSKVTADELSSALKRRLRLNQQDLKHATDEDEVNVPKQLRNKYGHDLDKTMPETVRNYISKKKAEVVPKVKLIVNKITTDDDLKRVSPLDVSQLPKLSHDLDKVLFQKGVKFLYFPKKKKYNFAKQLTKIDRLEEFEDQLCNNFVSPSKDSNLLSIARKENKKYYSSTSSMTSTLFQFYMLLNNFDPNNTKRFKFGNFTRLVSLLPSSFIVNKASPPEEIYSISSDKSTDLDNFLSKFGNILEAVLTNDEKDIELIREQDRRKKEMEKAKDPEQENNQELESIIKNHNDFEELERFTNPNRVYNIASYDKFIMRSQLDCFNEKLPGNGTFDLKSRATSGIRYNLDDPDIDKKSHNRQFFYRDEFDDLIRTGALLKYAFQARIGQMDGIFVAFHNINQFLAFEYLSLNDIDRLFFNNSDISSYLANTQFKFSLKIWSKVLDTILEDIDDKFDSFRVVLKSSQKPDLPFNSMKVNVVPLYREQVDKLQNFPDLLESDTNDLENKYEILSDYEKRLNEFNEKLTENGVLSYKIETSDLVNKQKLHPHALPRSENDSWIMDYRISREEPNVEEYLSQLAKTSGTITRTVRKNKGKTKSTPTNKDRHNVNKVDTNNLESKLKTKSNERNQKGNDNEAKLKSDKFGSWSSERQIKREGKNSEDHKKTSNTRDYTRWLLTSKRGGKNIAQKNM